MNGPGRSGRRRRSSTGWTVLLSLLLSGVGLLAGALVRPVAAEDDPATWAAKVERLLDDCEPRVVAEAFTSSTASWLATAPDEALRVLRAAMRNADGCAQASAADARTIAAHALGLAKAVRTTGTAAAPLPDLAQAYALACYARTTAAVGGQTTRADWSEAVDLLKGVHALAPGKGESLALAVELLSEWSMVAGDEAQPAILEAQALAAAALKESPGSLPIKLAAARVDMQAGLAGLAAKKAGAQALLTRGLDVLGANTDAFEANAGAVRAYHGALRTALLVMFPPRRST